jgi:AcrR family transcriptional regulator
MPRPPGTRNSDFEATRAALVRAAQKRLGAPDGTRASFREIAAAAGVSVATLKHYFGSREGLVEAVLANWHQQGMPYLLEVATGELPPVETSLRNVLERIGVGFRRSALDEVHSIGLAAGLREPTLGPAYLRDVLDPTLEAVEARLARHIARGELRGVDVRQLALSLVAPALLLLLHQLSLGGSRTRPLGYERFVKEHVAGFVRAWGADGAREKTRATERTGRNKR